MALVETCPHSSSVLMSMENIDPYVPREILSII